VDIDAGYEVDNDGDNFGQLAHILSEAYGNALMHDSLDAALEKKDLLLESVSIQFSSNLLYEITEGSCQSDEHTTSPPGGTCVLDDESVGLRNLTDLLSNTAYRLESLSDSAPPGDKKSDQAMARIGTLKYLYRTAFALSRIYLDKSQRNVYMDAANEELKMARKQMEIERNLCACSDAGHTTRLQQLSQLSDRLRDLRGENR
jgi:hypothetical protein